MSEPQGAPAPAAVTPPVATPAAAPPAVTPQPADENQPWFKERLARAEEQARAKVLSDLGITDPAKGKAAIEAAKKAEEDAKSQGQKLGETSKELESARAELARHQAATKEYAARMMLPLTDANRAAVKAGITAAGGNPEDPATQIAMIGALQASWTTAPAVTTQAAPPTTTAAQPTPPASGTAPPPNAPPASVTTSQPNHKEVHAALQKTNPFAAAEYAMAHVREVFPDQQQ